MANDDLHPKPHRINDEAWWYEEPQGVCVVVNGVVAPIIRWKAIENALARKNK